MITVKVQNNNKGEILKKILKDIEVVKKELGVYASDNLAASTFPNNTKERKVVEQNIKQDVNRVVHTKSSLATKFKRAGRSRKASGYFVSVLLNKDPQRVQRIAQASPNSFSFELTNDIEGLYNSHRTKSGRTRKPKQFYVTKGSTKSFIKQRQKKIGLSKSGWLQSDSKKRFSSFVTRHGKNGQMRIGANYVTIGNPFRASSKNTKNPIRAIDKAWRTVINRAKKRYK